MVAIFEELSNAGDETNLETLQSPNAKIVEWLHGNAGTSQESDFHHRIGHGDTDASPGSHTHNGKNSKFLFEGDVLAPVSGASTPTQLAAAITEIQVLLKQLGAT